MKTLKSTRGSRSLLSYLGLFTILAFILSVGFSSPAKALIQISRQLDFGAKNADVTSLQQFLAESPEIYPEGLVTGYYGSLTRAAVMRFQAKYGIVNSGTPLTTGYGRVGPTTLAKINSLLSSGTQLGVSGPAIFLQSAPQITATTATFNWITTNEVALGRLYYSNSPLQMNEGDINSVGFAVTTGQLGSYDGIARTSQSSTITGLQPNTTYYYTIVATDLGGNVSVIGPNNTFHTPSN